MRGGSFLEDCIVVTFGCYYLWVVEFDDSILSYEY